MKHESEPGEDILDLGCRMASAGIWFFMLAPVGILVAVVYVWVIAS